PSPAPFAYRNHCRFHRAPGGWGFRTRRGARVVRLDGCRLALPAIDAWLRAMEGRPGPEQIAVRCLGGALATSLEPRPLEATVAGHRYRVSPGSFFQVNSLLLPGLVRLVVERLHLDGGETVVDAYAGVGLFTAPLAARARRVVAVEAGPAAAADARANLAPFANVEVVAGRVEAVVAALPERLDAVVLDPPRAGCAPGVLAAVAARRPDRIVQVACDTATFARDAGRLAALGYRLVEVVPVDLFPQTFHVETVALWRPREPR
ncbi:MAG: 23S rRNA (uracil(1939)-C(5))-methyltransferase RlmD, partial [Nitrospirae bacterium]